MAPPGFLWGLVQRRILPSQGGHVDSSGSDHEDDEEGGSAWRRRQAGDPAFRRSESLGSVRTDAESGADSARGSNYTTFADESLPPMEAWTLRQPPAYLPYEAPAASSTPHAWESSSPQAQARTSRPSARSLPYSPGGQHSPGGDPQNASTPSSVSSVRSGSGQGRRESVQALSTPVPALGSGYQKGSPRGQAQQILAEEPQPPTEGTPRPVRRPYLELIRTSSRMSDGLRPTSPNQASLRSPEAQPLEQVPEQATDEVESQASSAALPGQALDAVAEQAQQEAAGRQPSVAGRHYSSQASLEASSPFAIPTEPQVPVPAPHIEVADAAAHPRKSLKASVGFAVSNMDKLRQGVRQGADIQPGDGSQRGTQPVPLPSAPVTPSHGRVLFRPGPIVIPATPESSEPQGFSKKFKSAVLGVGMMQSLRSLLRAGDSEAGHSEGGAFTKIVSRMKSSLALSPTGQMRTVALPSDVGGFDMTATLDLMAAVKAGEIDKVKQALDACADPNWQDTFHHSMTPMHYVASLGRLESHQHEARFTQETAKTIAQLLKRAGARMNTPDAWGFVPLQLAAYHGNIAILTFLLTSVGRSRPQLQKLLAHQDNHIKNTALHCAVEGHQTQAVEELLRQGASYRVQDYTSLTPWSLCAHHHREWGLQMITDLNIALATHGQLPADAVLQLALDLRTLEAVPVVLRAAAKWPDQVWQLMRAAIASGLQEFVELLAEDIPTVCPDALLEVPWGDVMVELATRFPTSFQSLIVGLNNVDFDTYVVPFIKTLNFDAEPEDEDYDPDDAMSSTSDGDRTNMRSSHSLTRAFTPSRAHMLGAGSGKGDISLRGRGRDKAGADSARSSRAGSERSSRASSRHTSRRPSMAGFMDEVKGNRMKSIMSLKSMLVLGRSADMGFGDTEGGSDDEDGQPGGDIQRDKHAQQQQQQNTGLPEAVKYLLLRCMVSSLNELDWKVWQAFVSGLHGSLALEIARFPKLFKRLTDSIATRVVPSWKEMQQERMDSVQPSNASVYAQSMKLTGTNGSFRLMAQRASKGVIPAFGPGSASGKSLASLDPEPESKWATSGPSAPEVMLVTSIEEYEAHKLLNVNHLVAAAIASRSNINVYNIVTAMDRWLEVNPSCYLSHLDPENVASLAADYPEACKLLLSFEAQGQADVKVPGYLCAKNQEAVYRCSELALGFIWQDDGLVALRHLGINDLTRLQRWILSDITFDAVLKIFKSSVANHHSARVVADNLETLLNSGLTGKDINKLVQLDTDLSDVLSALQGGLSAGFVHQMLTHKISFQVVTEMLGVMPDRNTLWNNVRHQPVWSRFPSDSYNKGITYEYIRIFFETWEEYHFDKRFIDLLFDFHDPLFVKLRTALEYVNSNKAFHVSLAEEEAEIQKARKNRSLYTLSILAEAFLRQQFFSPYRALIIVFVYGGAVFLPKLLVTKLPLYMHKLRVFMGGSHTALQDTLHASPKLDALSETLPITNLAQLGERCYLRALLSANAPASTFGLPVVEAIIQVKWSTYGFLFKSMLLIEHVLHLGFIVAYAAFYAYGDGFCTGQMTMDEAGNPVDWDVTELFNCNEGIATLVLDACLVVMCLFETSVYVRQLVNLGPRLWLRALSNWANMVTLALQACLVVGHVQMQVTLLQASIALLVLLNFLKLGWFAILNERLGALVRIITQTFADTMYFLFLLGILYVGFALAFLTLAPRVPADDGTPPLTGGLLTLKLFTIMMGDITSDFMENQILGTFALPGLSVLLMLAYAIVLLIVAFNMLVAIMNDTFNRIKGAEKNELLKLKALVLVDLEAGFTQAQLADLNKLLMGKYLHTLRPKLLDAAQDDGLDMMPMGATTTSSREPVDKHLRLQHLFSDVHWGPRGPSRPSSAKLTSRFTTNAGTSGPSRPGSARRVPNFGSHGGASSRPASSSRRKTHTQGAMLAPSRPMTARRPTHAGGSKSRPTSAFRQILRPKSAFHQARHAATADEEDDVTVFTSKPSFMSVSRVGRSRAASRQASFNIPKAAQGSPGASLTERTSGAVHGGSRTRVGFMGEDDSDLHVQRTGPSSSKQGVRIAEPDHDAGSVSEEVPEALRDAQQRVRRMMSTKMMTGFYVDSLMTPAEALQVAHAEDVDGDEDALEDSGDSWEEEMTPSSRLAQRMSHGGGLLTHAPLTGRHSMGDGLMQGSRISLGDAFVQSGRFSTGDALMQGGRMSKPGYSPRMSLGAAQGHSNSGASYGGHAAAITSLANSGYWPSAGSGTGLNDTMSRGSNASRGAGWNNQLSRSDLQNLRHAATKVLAAAMALQDDMEGQAGGDEDAYEEDLPEYEDEDYDSDLEEQAPREFKQGTAPPAALPGHSQQTSEHGPPMPQSQPGSSAVTPKSILARAQPFDDANFLSQALPPSQLTVKTNLPRSQTPDGAAAAEYAAAPASPPSGPSPKSPGIAGLGRRPMLTAAGDEERTSNARAGPSRLKFSTAVNEPNDAVRSPSVGNEGQVRWAIELKPRLEDMQHANQSDD